MAPGGQGPGGYAPGVGRGVEEGQDGGQVEDGPHRDGDLGDEDRGRQQQAAAGGGTRAVRSRGATAAAVTLTDANSRARRQVTKYRPGTKLDAFAIEPGSAGSPGACDAGGADQKSRKASVGRTSLRSTKKTATTYALRAAPSRPLRRMAGRHRKKRTTGPARYQHTAAAQHGAGRRHQPSGAPQQGPTTTVPNRLGGKNGGARAGVIGDATAHSEGLLRAGAALCLATMLERDDETSKNGKRWVTPI